MQSDFPYSGGNQDPDIPGESSRIQIQNPSELFVGHNFFRNRDESVLQPIHVRHVESQLQPVKTRGEHVSEFAPIVQRVELIHDPTLQSRNAGDAAVPPDVRARQASYTPAAIPPATRISREDLRPVSARDVGDDDIIPITSRPCRSDEIPIGDLLTRGRRPSDAILPIPKTRQTTSVDTTPFEHRVIRQSTAQLAEDGHVMGEFEALLPGEQALRAEMDRQQPYSLTLVADPQVVGTMVTFTGREGYFCTSRSLMTFSPDSARTGDVLEITRPLFAIDTPVLAAWGFKVIAVRAPPLV